MCAPPTITVWVTDARDDTRSALPTLGRGRGPANFTSEALATSLAAMLGAVAAVLEGAEEGGGKFEVQEAQVSLAVNASGGFELVAKGEAGAEAALTLTLRRKVTGQDA
jgi:hypothetical protein